MSISATFFLMSSMEIEWRLILGERGPIVASRCGLIIKSCCNHSFNIELTINLKKNEIALELESKLRAVTDRRLVGESVERKMLAPPRGMCCPVYPFSFNSLKINLRSLIDAIRN
jgi:hypothetical protein